MIPMIDRAVSTRGRAITGAVGRATRFVLFGNLFLAAGATAWTFSTYSALGLPRSSVNGWLLTLVFAGVVVVYTVDRLFTYERYEQSEESERSVRRDWIDVHRRSLKGVLVGAVGAVGVSLPFVGPYVVAVLAGLGVVSLAYSAPVLRNASVGLKQFGLLKIFLIASVWAVVTAALPPIDAGAPVFTRDLCFLVAERFLFVFAITLPFDVRDVRLDASLDIRTIPVRIGVRRTKALVATALVVYLVLKIEHYRATEISMVVPALLTDAYAMALLAFMGWRDDDYVYALLWDGAILVQATLAVVFARW